MASSSDVRDIMGLAPGPGGGGEITREMILGTDKPKKSYAKKSEGQRRPEGMARELYNLLYGDNKDGAPPVIPTDSSMMMGGGGKDKGYKQTKAKLGMRKVRPWKWTAFANPARKDGLMLRHWRRAADEGKEYAFARFNRRLEMPAFTDVEYRNHLSADGWTREETDRLLDLCERFDLRFAVIKDRWRGGSERTIEDLKERYYGICEKLETLHVDPTKAAAKTYAYDADHERRRKEQLRRLYGRTQEQVEEEESLRAELKKIEARKRERERKTQDLQKLIMQADSASSGAQQQPSAEKKAAKKKASSTSSTTVDKQRKEKQEVVGVATDAAGIKFPDARSSGVALRSHRMKLPASVGQKKAKAIEQMLQEIGVETNPIPTEEVCGLFNELRSDLVLLYELKNALSGCELELHSLKGQYEALCPGKTLEIPDMLRHGHGLHHQGSPARATAHRHISDVIDVVGNGSAQPVRKRKAALEQGNILKKIKNKNF